MWTQNTKIIVDVNLFDATRCYSNRAIQSAKKKHKTEPFCSIFQDSFDEISLNFVLEQKLLQKRF